ncbi:MAG: serine/threonine-protein kinase [Myxococcota bacterium]
MSEPHAPGGSSEQAETVPHEEEEPLHVEAGTTIGRYVVSGVLGHGAMGVVLAAVDPKLGRKVALKLLFAEADAEGQTRLQREGQALARLSHPHVVKVHDVGTHEGRVFVAMELVEGQNLAQWLAAERRPWREVVRVFVQAGQGLAAAHSAGLVHRDFKPANLLMGSDGTVKVTDFGLARARAEPAPSVEAPDDTTGSQPLAAALDATLTRTGALVGTPVYMAPEQLDGRAADPRSDQFSFCVALYEALAGHRPFEGATPAQLSIAIEEQRFAKPLGLSLPVPLRAAVRRGLAVDPAARHPDLGALLSVLRRASRGRRLKAIWAGAAGMAVAGVWWATRPAPPEVADYCARVGERLADVWDDGRRDAAQRGFETTELPYANETFTMVRTRLDTQASTWVGAQREVCEAQARLDRADGAPSSEEQEAIDRRMICLHRRLTELEQLGSLLAEADAELVQRAPRAVAALGSIERCSTTSQGPTGGGRAAGMVRAEALARVEVLTQAGRYDEAIEYAEGAVAAVAEGSRWSQAQVYLARARAHERAGHAEDAERDYHQTFSAAVAAGHDELVLVAALGLAIGNSRAQTTESDAADPWVEHAEAALARMPKRPDLRASFENTRGQVEFNRGRYETAQEHFARALQYRREDLDDDDYRLAPYHRHLGHVLSELQRYEEAIDAQKEALRIERLHFGDRHPQVALAMTALGTDYSVLGQSERALELEREALEILDESLGRSHPAVVNAAINLGSAQARAGQDDAAERTYLDALERARSVPGSPSRDVGLILANLGVHAEQRGKLGPAADYLAQALEAMEASMGPDHPMTQRVKDNLAQVRAKQAEADSAD